MRLDAVKRPTPENPNPKPRPIKVALCNPHLRGLILKNCRKIRENPNLKKMRIGISADKSKAKLDREKREYGEYQRRKALNEPVVFYAGWCRLKDDLPPRQEDSARGAMGGRAAGYEGLPPPPHGAKH